MLKYYKESRGRKGKFIMFIIRRFPLVASMAFVLTAAMIVAGGIAGAILMPQDLHSADGQSPVFKIETMPQASLLDYSIAQSCKQNDFNEINPEHCRRFAQKCISKDVLSFDRRLCE